MHCPDAATEHVQVKGRVAYNGRELSEFIPERTAVYVTQEDQHMPELTVRETLDFSARCQGTGSHACALPGCYKKSAEGTFMQRCCSHWAQRFC